jgi:hypothetical protein
VTHARPRVRLQAKFWCGAEIDLLRQEFSCEIRKSVHESICICVYFLTRTQWGQQLVLEGGIRKDGPDGPNGPKASLCPTGA